MPKKALRHGADMPYAMLRDITSTCLCLIEALPPVSPGANAVTLPFVRFAATLPMPLRVIAAAR